VARAQTIVYGALFALLLGSGALSAVYQMRGSTVWVYGTVVYVCVLVLYTWYLFALLLLHDLRPKRFPRYSGQKMAVLVPTFNEPGDLLERALRSVVDAHGSKQVIVIDDGSTNGELPRLRELAAELGATLHEFPDNRGKREALHYATKNLIDSDVEFVVTIDSDTVLDRDALIRVVEPLINPKVGAATGDVRLLNEHQNALTRMVGTYYWIGLNIYKQAQSVISSVVCCSGCLAAYRAPLLRAIIDEFAQQTFLGEKCTHSEDRHLTNLVLRSGLDVVYVPEAISWTETPSTIMSFVRQQRRWKRGYIRESIYTLTYAWRVKRLLWLQIFAWDLTAPFLSFGLRMGLIVAVVRNPLLLPLVVLPSWVALMLMRYIFVPLRAWRKLPGLFLYMLFYELCLYWLNLWALFTVKNRSWVTRVHPAAPSGSTAF
jgi:hyaluronan synthase